MQHALQVLDFDSVLNRLAALCETSMGLERARNLLPCFEDVEVWARLENTLTAFELISRHDPPSLGAARDLRAAFHRASKGAVLGAEELYESAECLRAMREMKSFLSAHAPRESELFRLAEVLPSAETLERKLLASIEPGGVVRDEASEELGSIRRKKAAVQTRVLERIQRYASGRTREYLSDPIYTVRDGRYVVPVRTEHKAKIKGIVHDVSSSGQTVFVEPEDVLQLGNQLREVEGAEREEVARILAALSAILGKVADAASAGIESAGGVDSLLAQARLGSAMNASVPERAGMPGLELSGAIHPLLDEATAVPLDIAVGFEQCGLLITGPNTGGKTVAIKTVGLLAAMAQSGLMVPARHARLGVFGQLWADIGDEQSLQQSLSTFSGHIKNIAEALSGLKEGALVLLDEIGAGTDPSEGAALARAILTEIAALGGKVVASTHYGELKAFAYASETFVNAAMEFDHKSLRPTYRLLMGAPGASQALRIAERYGIPKRVVEAAREGLGQAEQDMARMIESLEAAQRAARAAQSEADRRANDLRNAERNAERKLAEADEIRRSVHARGQAEIEAELRRIRLEAAAIFDQLKAADQRSLEAARIRLADLHETSASRGAAEGAQRAEEVAVKRGDRVRVQGYSQLGSVLSDPKGGSVSVQMGPLKMSVRLELLQPVEADQPRSPKPSSALRLERAQTAVSEIHLRAMRAEDAIRDLEEFLDDALLAGLPSVRIVHGKGEGILRKVCRETLKRHPHVASFRDGEPSEGGQGVTIASLA